MKSSVVFCKRGDRRHVAEAYVKKTYSDIDTAIRYDFGKMFEIDNDSRYWHNT